MAAGTHRSGPFSSRARRPAVRTRCRTRAVRPTAAVARGRRRPGTVRRPSRRARGRPVRRRRFRRRFSVVLDRLVRTTGDPRPIAELLDGPVRSRRRRSLSVNRPRPRQGLGPVKRPECRRAGPRAGGRRSPDERGFVAGRCCRPLRPFGRRPVDGPRRFRGVVPAAGPCGRRGRSRHGYAFARRSEPQFVGPVHDHAQLARVVHVPVLARHHARPRLRLDLERSVRSFVPVRVRSVRVVSAKQITVLKFAVTIVFFPVGVLRRWCIGRTENFERKTVRTPRCFVIVRIRNKKFFFRLSYAIPPPDDDGFSHRWCFVRIRIGRNADASDARVYMRSFRFCPVVKFADCPELHGFRAGSAERFCDVRCRVTSSGGFAQKLPD